MSSSSTILDLISASQAQKEATANALFDSASPAILFARRASTSSALTWGFYGGRVLVNTVLTSIANGTVALTASTTNYVEATSAGVVSKNVIAFTPGSIPLYTVVTGASAVSSYTDERAWVVPSYLTQDITVSMTTADVTLSAAQARAEYIKVNGAFTGNRAIVVPNNGEWRISHQSTGGFTLTIKTLSGTGVVVALNDIVTVRADGTNVILISSATSGTPPSGFSTIGKHAMYVGAGSMSPSYTGGCSITAKIATAANQPDIVSLDFDPITQEYAQFSIVMPKKWNEGTLTFKPHWSHAATTTNFGVTWDLQGVAVSNDDAIAVAFGTSQLSTDVGGTTNDFYTGPESSAITIAGTPAAEDIVFFRVSRVTGDAGDTMGIDARLHGITIYLTTDSETDA